jgi:hypothetical protein
VTDDAIDLWDRARSVGACRGNGATHEVQSEAGCRSVERVAFGHGAGLAGG